MTKLDENNSRTESAAKAATTPSPEVRQPQSGGRSVVRLSVNLADDVAAALKALSLRQGISITEGVRRAIAVWKLVSEANEQGERVMIVQGEGKDAKYREVIIL